MYWYSMHICIFVQGLGSYSQFCSIAIFVKIYFVPLVSMQNHLIGSESETGLDLDLSLILLKNLSKFLMQLAQISFSVHVVSMRLHISGALEEGDFDIS